MPLDRKGKDLLKQAKYDKIKREIIRAIVKRIRDEANVGEEFHSIVEKVLKEERFQQFFEELVRQIQKSTRLPEKESKGCASLLVSEAAGEEVCRVVPSLIVESERKPNQRRMEYFDRLSKQGMLRGQCTSQAIVCGKGGFGKSVRDVFMHHPIVLLVVGAGAAFILIASLLIGSPYETLLAALTLQPSDASSVSQQVGNVLAAFGGVLLFFTSVTLIVSHLLEQDRKRRTVYRLAEQYLEKSR